MNDDPNDNIISRYSRADALRDGVLIDATPMARLVGFRIPVALTSMAWARCVAVPEGVKCQDEAARLFDVLHMLRVAIRLSKMDSSELDYYVHVRNDNQDGVPPRVKLKSICGPGDNLEPVITIMLPDED